jgi:hypothetical protein
MSRCDRLRSAMGGRRGAAYADRRHEPSGTHGADRERANPLGCEPAQVMCLHPRPKARGCGGGCHCASDAHGRSVAAQQCPGDGRYEEAAAQAPAGERASLGLRHRRCTPTAAGAIACFRDERRARPPLEDARLMYMSTTTPSPAGPAEAEDAIRFPPSIALADGRLRFRAKGGAAVSFAHTVSVDEDQVGGTVSRRAPILGRRPRKSSFALASEQQGRLLLLRGTGRTCSQSPVIVSRKVLA